MRTAKLPIQFSGDENYVHPRHAGHGRLDMVLALLAIFISAVSLFVAIEHGRIEQRLVAANSWPFLAISSNSGAGLISYSIGEGGVGPAKLERRQAFYRGGEMPDLDTLLERCCGLSVPRTDADQAVFDRLRQSLREIGFRGCYCSVFDECWQASFMDRDPRGMRSCATAPSFNDTLFDRPSSAAAP